MFATTSSTAGASSAHAIRVAHSFNVQPSNTEEGEAAIQVDSEEKERDVTQQDRLRRRSEQLLSAGKK